MPNGKNPRYYIIIYSSRPNIFIHSPEVAKISTSAQSDFFSNIDYTKLFVEFFSSNTLLSRTPQIQWTISLSVILYSFHCSLKSNLISLMNEKYIKKKNTTKLIYISISFQRQHKHTVNKNQSNLVVCSSYVLL